jgi:hypothetical protein
MLYQLHDGVVKFVGAELIVIGFGNLPFRVNGPEDARQVPQGLTFKWFVSDYAERFCILLHCALYWLRLEELAPKSSSGGVCFGLGRLPSHTGSISHILLALLVFSLRSKGIYIYSPFGLLSRGTFLTGKIFGFS